MTTHIPRYITPHIRAALQRGKSVLLLGARQTGKTTVVMEEIKPDISYSLAQARVRQRYEQDPSLLEKELEEKISTYAQPPLIFIDEIQKIPRIMDIVQHLIDQKKALFILTGSSARKLTHGPDVNLLPGRVVVLTMTPLLYEELQFKPLLDTLLTEGTLPAIITNPDPQTRQIDLYSYVTTYLEEEIRAEALVRNVGHFSRFLEIAAGESGLLVNFTRLSQDIGVSDHTIAHYYQILEDCLITFRIDPLILSQTKRRLIRSAKYLFFDLGIRRACANEITPLPLKMSGNLFEHYIGNQLLFHALLSPIPTQIKYWRDASGLEIDFIIDQAHQYIPIEVKWSDKPQLSDARHLIKFMEENMDIKTSYIVCRTPHRYKITDKIIALPWQELARVFS